MYKKILLYIILAVSIVATQPEIGRNLVLPWAKSFSSEQIIAQRALSLNNRYSKGNTFVNDVFKDNILLTLSYLSGEVTHASEIKWEEVRKPFTYEVVLEPGEVFAFHEDILPQFGGKPLQTTNANFNAAQGFVSSGSLYGDGVCHLASFIYQAAKEAGLHAVAPVNHDFREIPGIPREYGVSIYFMPGNPTANAMQNLYVENNQEQTVRMVFRYDNNLLGLTIIKNDVSRISSSLTK